MRQNIKQEENSYLAAGAICLLIVVFGVLHLGQVYAAATVFAGLGMLVILLRKDLSYLKNAPTLLLLGYAAVSFLTGFWAMSGKFFLREYTKIFIAVGFFLLVTLCGRDSKTFRRQVMFALAFIPALLALANVEAATSGVVKRLLMQIDAYKGLDIGFEKGTRLTGIFSNANSMATIQAIGIFFSVALLCSEKENYQRAFGAVMLAMNAYSFLLMFSMGAICFFAVSIVVYLIFARQGRISALVRMLEGAVPTLVFAFTAVSFFNRSGALKLVPLALMALNAAAAALLELKLADRLIGLLERRQKLAIATLIGLVVLVALYIVIGLNLSGPYVFGSTITRGVYPEPGEHTLQVDADGEVKVTITSQDITQAMMHTETRLYKGPAQEAVFTVPEGSKVCYIVIRAEAGTHLNSMSVDGEDTVHLKYKLLPEYIANRVQGMFANENALQRLIFMEDGMKMFRASPIIGNGVGAFETGLSGVQSFYYNTKYVHNHYIQVLLESGILGFALYIGAMLGMVLLLIRSYRRPVEGEAMHLYPAMWAMLVMVLTHSFMEVSLSIPLVLWAAYAGFGLIVRECAQKKDAAEPQSSAVPGAGQKKRPAGKPAAKPKKKWLPALAAAALPTLFLILLGGNLIADDILNTEVATVDEFFDSCKTAAAIDVYEMNDSKLSYLSAMLEYEQMQYLDQANRYADDLLHAYSNSLPASLTAYYTRTEQYDKAVEAAMRGAVCSVSDASVWNTCAGILAEAFLTPDSSPLLTQGDSLIPALMQYRQMLLDRNATALETIGLDISAAAFFDTVERLSSCGGDSAKIGEILAQQTIEG